MEVQMWNFDDPLLVTAMWIAVLIFVWQCVRLYLKRQRKKQSLRRIINYMFSNIGECMLSGKFLPIDMSETTKRELSVAGVRFRGKWKENPLFQKVKLPWDWKVVIYRTHSDVGSVRYHLIDANGAIRGVMFCWEAPHFGYAKLETLQERGENIQDFQEKKEGN